jgi:D-serine deaminase-like pyridoxal phosphate-dependent protein
MKALKIIRPTLIVDKNKAITNIRRMMLKISQSPGRIRFRPHFKTHQSARIGEWFRELGVTAVTVSSVDMASYFAQNGWNDITIAIPANPLEIESINQLAETVELNLLVDSAEMAGFLNLNLNQTLNVWLEIDTGHHRTGIEWDQKNEILSTAEEIQKLPKLLFKGLLTHSGHSYKVKSPTELIEIYDDTVTKMSTIREYLHEKGIPGVEISIGDTPTCSAVEQFYGINEVRCGNFVFYDLMQLTLGTCKEEDIAAAVACPVIGCYPQQNRIVIYGGAIHLSKESMTHENGEKIFGLVALPDPDSLGWGPTVNDTYLSDLSQEHGIIKADAEFCRQVNVGDILMVLPVHSCLTANLLKDQFYIKGRESV